MSVPKDDTTIDWSAGESQGRVQLPDGRHLCLKASGPPRQPGTPAVIIEHGVGGAASEWVAVQRLVARFARVYTYERAGHHHSDAPAGLPTPEKTAADLRALLKTAKVEPPYLLVGHSFGGVLIRQYLADYPEDVFGMLIVDSAPVVNKVPDSWTTLLGDAKYEDIVNLSANRVLSDEEWETAMREGDMNGDIAAKEAEAVLNGGAQALKDRLHGKQLLGEKRLSVIFCDESHDFRKCYEYGVRHGHGTDEAREALRKHLEDMSDVDEARMREHLVLSSNARFVKAEGKQRTHNVQVVDPDFVTREIRWVLDGRED